ncbi:hypothetical protein Q9189_003538 [Teloschistes chrysophthalmus]
MAWSWWSSLVLWYLFFLFVQAVPPVTLTTNPLASHTELVTSYAPVLTICPIGDFKPSLSGSSEPSQVPVVQRRQGAIKYYGNFSVAASRHDECSTAYSPTLTRSCATTLTPVGGPPIPITVCDQEVTFSTDHGYRLAQTSTGSGSSDGGGEIETLTTLYVADWTDVATGLPRGLVKEEVCSKAGCTIRLERWIPVTTETVQTLTSTVQFTGVLSTVGTTFLSSTSHCI